MFVPIETLFLFPNWFGDFLVVYQSLIAHKSISDTSLLVSALSQLFVFRSVAQTSQRVFMAWVSSHLLQLLVHYLFDLAHAQLFSSCGFLPLVLTIDLLLLSHPIFCSSFCKTIKALALPQIGCLRLFIQSLDDAFAVNTEGLSLRAQAPDHQIPLILENIQQTTLDF